MTTIKAGTTLTTGFVVDADASGTLILQSGGSNTAVAFNSQTQQAVFTHAVSQPGSFMFRNKLINGNFDIWQRGTSQTTNSMSSADRWYCFSDGSTKTASQQAFALGQTDVPNNPKYFMRHVVTSVAGAGNFVCMDQRIEGVQTLSGQSAIVSFWAKADSNKNIAIDFQQYFGTGGTPSASVFFGGNTSQISLTTSWTKYSLSVTIPSVAGKIIGTDINDFVRIRFWFDAGSNYNNSTDSLGQQSGTFDIAQVQVEEGAVATPFEQRPLSTELLLCQRYYQVLSSAGTNAFIAFGNGAGFSNVSDFVIRTITVMRSIPSVSLSARSTFFIDSGNPGSALSAIDISTFAVTIRSNAGTTNAGCKLRANGVTTAFITFDSEL